MCTTDCENLPRMLSSEPDEFPIEEGIAPLVFELKRTGFFFPCWSCEGHPDRSGALWKLPQVWFYCDSTLHLRLLAELLKMLETRKAVTASWSVAVTHSDRDNTETTFALQPYLQGRGDVSLTMLRSDVKAIAAALAEGIATAAQRLKADLSGSLP
jgi:hypothetical protein